MPRDSIPWDGPNGYAIVCDQVARAWRPVALLVLRAWADAHRYLSTKESAEGGSKWQTTRIPFLAGIMDALDESDPCEIVVFIKSAQTGGTNVGLNWLGRTIHHDPVPFAALFPTDRLAARWVRGKLDTMIDATPVLRAIIPRGRKGEAGNTVTEKHFPGGIFYAWSANIPSDVSSTSVCRLLADEVDRFPPELENEGDPLELALRRQGGYVTRRKAFFNSTPTIESLSHINRWWKRSTMARFYVPCPHCGTMQTLKFNGAEAHDEKPSGRLVYDPDHPERAFYACEQGCVIEEKHKTTMLERGEWRHEHGERTTIRGFHVNALYTPIGLGDSWAQIARVAERSKRSPEAWKTFTNTYLGETHEDKAEKLDWEALAARREAGMRFRVIPAGCLILTCAVDVQKDRLEVLLCGWGRNEQCWLLDHVVINGDPQTAAPWTELDGYLAQPLRNAFGVDMRIAATAVDAGYLQHEVTNYTRTRGARNVFAVKGMPHPGRLIIARATLVDVKYRGVQDKRGAELYPVGSSTAKHSIFARLRADGGDRDKPAPMAEARHYRLPEDLSDDFLRQVTAEVWDPRARKWVKTAERNEALDLLVYNMAAAMHRKVRLNAMQPSDWEALEAKLQPAVAAAPIAAAPQLGKVAVAKTGGFFPTSALVDNDGGQ
jgi:phage terminase large subunit GpA-like protein